MPLDLNKLTSIFNSEKADKLATKVNPLLNKYAAKKLASVLEDQNKFLSDRLNGRKPIDTQSILDFTINGNLGLEQTYLNLRDKSVKTYALGSFEELINRSNDKLSEKIGSGQASKVLNFILPYVEDINLPGLGKISRLRDGLEPKSGQGNFIPNVQKPYPEFFYISLNNTDVVDYVLPINPSNMNLVLGTKTKNLVENIGGYVEMNGIRDTFDMISFEGVTGGFKDNINGYESFFRERTDKYKEFINLLNIFKSNADLYAEGILTDSSYVIINFIGFLVKGKFISFSYTESEDKPFMFDLNFDFKVYELIVNV